MIPVSLLALVLTAQDTQPKGAALISKMFAYYANAQSMTGTIHMTQEAQGVAVTLDTTIAYKTPSMLYVKQVLDSPSAAPPAGGGDPRQWLVTSDGVSFTYDYPNEQRRASDKPEPGRLWETDSPASGGHLDYRQIFRAASRSLGDISIPEFVAIAGPFELAAARDQIATIVPGGTDIVDGQSVFVVAGDWRLDLHTPVSGKYRLFITADGQLKRFIETETVRVKFQDLDTKPQKVITTWDVNLHPNAIPDAALFTVVK